MVEKEFLHQYVLTLEEELVVTEQIVTNVMFLQGINTKEKKQVVFLELLEHLIAENGNTCKIINT